MTEISEPKRPQLPEGWAWEWDARAEVIEAVKRMGTSGAAHIISYSASRGLRGNVNTEWRLEDPEPSKVAKIVVDYARELWPVDPHPPAFGVRSAIAKLRAERDWARHRAEVAKAVVAFRTALAEHVQASDGPFEVVSSLVRDEEIERAVAELELGGWPATWKGGSTARRVILPDGEE